MRNAAIVVSLGFALTACGDGDRGRANQLQDQVNGLRTEVSKYQGEIKTLKDQLDAERNGPDRLLARAENDVAGGDSAAAKKTLSELTAKFPDSAQAKVARVKLLEFDAQAKAAEKARLAEEERKAQQRTVAFAKLDSALNKSKDEFDGITWITHKSQPVLAKYIAVYFGTKDGQVGNYPMRMKLNYYGDDWLFVQGVTIKADEKTFELNSLSFERDNGGGSIWEWSDTAVDRSMIATIANSQRTIIRFDGRQYRNDFVVPESQKKAMRDMLLAWERYGGKL